MPPETSLFIASLVPVAFVAAFGACLGSLINVIVYRLPLGIGLVTPPSRCPHCETRLTFRENIPIFGWLVLRGRCRFCKSRISPEYPLVEAFVAGLFAALTILFYLVPRRAEWLGIPFGLVRPEWALGPPEQTWPVMVVFLMLFGLLVAMTLVDAKTYTIPLVLPWVATALAVVIYPLHALWLASKDQKLWYIADGWRYAIATPVGDHQWWWLGASLGGVVGVGASLLLLRLGLIRRSFEDYAQWEAQHLSAPAAAAADQPLATPPPGDTPAETWIAYPHARREMVKELAFLGPIAGLGFLGGWLASRWAAGLTTTTPNPDPFLAPIVNLPAMPLWLNVLGGLAMGYLIGGGVVWLVRIFGSLAFGKEAMGMGDVHLMAAVGACLGWIDSVLAFFAAAFVGVAWAILGAVLGGRAKRAMPYGPFLAVATLLVVLFKPAIELGLTYLLQLPPGSKPINIP